MDEFKNAQTHKSAYESYPHQPTMDIDVYRVYKIIPHNCRFISPFSELPSYYIWTSNKNEDKYIGETIIKLYWSKLKYAEKNADRLINQALYTNFEVNRTTIGLSKDMCQRLLFESFILNPENKELGYCLSKKKNGSAAFSKIF